MKSLLSRSCGFAFLLMDLPKSKETMPTNCHLSLKKKKSIAFNHNYNGSNRNTMHRQSRVPLLSDLGRFGVPPSSCCFWNSVVQSLKAQDPSHRAWPMRISEWSAEMGRGVQRLALDSNDCNHFLWLSGFCGFRRTRRLPFQRHPDSDLLMCMGPRRIIPLFLRNQGGNGS